MSLLIAAVALVGLLSAACTPGDPQQHSRPAQYPGRPTGPVSTGSPLAIRTAEQVQAPRGGPFGPRSEWRRDISKAPTAANSAAMARNLAWQVADRYGGVAAFNVQQYNASFYRVPAHQQRVTVLWDDCQGKGYLPEGLYGRGGLFEQVPLPSNAVPARGTDASLVVYQPSTNTMWEFWRLAKRADGWHACWGGRLRRVSTAPGWYPANFGASASGLSIIGGAIGIREARAGRIDHALALAIPSPASAHIVSWPAQRSDGFDAGPDAIPEGTRLRLDPSVDVARLRLHPLAAMVARAAQKYGFIVTDKSGAVAVVTESGAASQAVTGRDPWVALLAGTPDYLVMKGFPWDRLQALPKDYGRPK